MVTSLAGVAFGSSLVDRRERRRSGAELLAKALLLLHDSNPIAVPNDASAARRLQVGEWLWGRWFELREPLAVFAHTDRSPGVGGAGGKALIDLADAVGCAREALEKYGDPGEAEARRDAEEKWHEAKESLDALDRAFADSFRVLPRVRR